MRHEILSFFANYIERELGIVYSETNHYQLQNRLEEMVRILAFKDLEELYAKAKVSIDSNLKQLLLDSATNNETSFFRDPRVFKSFSEFMLPELFEKAKQRKPRIWSAACSYAQEPFSLSMLIQETGPKFEIEIQATDIATKVLERAKTGRYTQLEVQRGLPAPLLVKYFKKDDENFWTLVPEIRNRVKFDQANLLGPLDRFGKFDIIFCRNVLIYQSVENKRKIIEKLVNCLHPGGWLVMGAGESLIGLSEAFDSVTLGDAVVYRLKVTQGMRLAG